MPTTPNLLLLCDLHLKTHSSSDSFTLKMVPEMYAKTLQELQRIVKMWKVMFTLEHTMKAQRGSRGLALLSLTLVLDLDGWLMPHSCCFTPRKETRYPLHRKLSGPQAWMRKVSPPTGIQSLTHPPLRKSPSTTWASIQDVTKPWKPKLCNRLRMVKDRVCSN